MTSDLLIKITKDKLSKKYKEQYDNVLCSLKKGFYDIGEDDSIQNKASKIRKGNEN